jgi:hypothetical protein
MLVKAFIGGGIGYVTVDLGELGPLPVTNTAATVIGGETYDAQPTDTVFRADSSNGEQPVIQLTTPTYIGQKFTVYWEAWATGAGQPVGPLVIAPSGIKMQSVNGQSVSGSAGLVTETTLTTPGGEFTWEWTGTELISV